MIYACTDHINSSACQQSLRRRNTVLFHLDRDLSRKGKQEVDLQGMLICNRSPVESGHYRLLLCYWCVWRRGWDQHPLARHVFSWERILACCFRGAGFRWGTGKVWLLCTTGLRSKPTSQTIGRRVLSLHT